MCFLFCDISFLLEGDFWVIKTHIIAVTLVSNHFLISRSLLSPLESSILCYHYPHPVFIKCLHFARCIDGFLYPCLSSLFSIIWHNFQLPNPSFPFFYSFYIRTSSTLKWISFILLWVSYLLSSLFQRCSIFSFTYFYFSLW